MTSKRDRKASALPEWPGNRKLRVVSGGVIDELMVPRVGGPRGWDAFRQDCMRWLYVDPQGLCDAFTEKRPFVLPRGVAHTYLEPVCLHFQQHRCGEGPPQAFECAAARALLTLALAIPVERDRPLVQPLVTLFSDLAATITPSLELATARLRDVERAVARGDVGHVGSAGFPPYEHGQEVLVLIRKAVRAAGHYAQQYDAPQATDAPASRRQLINAEGELLACGVSPKVAAQLLRDCKEGKTSGDQKLRNRKKLADEAIQVADI
jgi:hypothetical protein